MDSRRIASLKNRIDRIVADIAALDARLATNPSNGFDIGERRVYLDALPELVGQYAHALASRAA